MVNLSLDSPRRGARGGGPSFLGRVLFVGALLLLGAVGGFYAGRFWERRVVGTPAPVAAAEQVPPSPPAAAPAPAPAPGAPADVAAQVAGAPAATPPAASAPGAAQAAPLPAPASAPAPSPVRRASVLLKGSLEESLAAALAPADKAHATQLTQVVNRLLVWHLQVAREGQKGDRMELLWEPPPPLAPADPNSLVAGLPATKEPVVHAVRYGSQRLGKEIAAYRFQPEGSRWARYYQPDGTELEERLVEPVVADYEQVTSLLRDGRKHEGVDFKTPTGTPVYAPFDGVVTKRNWNFRYNGNCLELADSKTGRRAIFLHLDVLPKEIAVGKRVAKGELIAASGNSGRSYAPHLHYQLEDANGRVLDPFVIHATKRLALEGPQRAAFDAARARLDPLMLTAAAR
jgi:murein DD-endopeptidase MepM/ murein hydrolase activator NlpD